MSKSGGIGQGGHYGIPVGRAPKGSQGGAIRQTGYPGDINAPNPVGNGAGQRQGGFTQGGGTNPVGGKQ